MSLLTPSESHSFNSFLSNVELGDLLTSEWSALVDTLPVPAAHGREALTKATKDLMSLEAASGAPEGDSRTQLTSPPIVNSNWPSLPGEAEQRRPQQNYTYGFGIPRPPSRPFFHPASPNALGGPSQPQSSSPYNVPRSYSPATPSDLNPSSPFFPSVSEAPSQAQSRPGPFGASSASALHGHTSSISKRPLPSDSDVAAGPSGALSKRRRPSVVTQDLASPAADERPQSLTGRSNQARSASLSSSTAAGGSSSQAQDAASRPALLSPSQKRANHIQSEQKRRANIRKGYEALCEVVPALKEAIKLEEEAARVAEDDKEKGRKRKRKTKNASVQPEESYHTLDGRAGPKSENVVLQKTIDHLHALLAERDALKERLNTARAALSPGHPALQISANHLDDDKVPMWEREWNGGVGWNDDAGDDE